VICNGFLNPLLDHVFDTRFGIAGNYSIHRCENCGLEQVCPLLTDLQLKHLYETYYNFGGEKGTLYVAMREWFFHSPFYRLWVWLDGDHSFHNRKGTGKLLDVGCNEGRGLRLYRRNGFEAQGLEVNQNAAARARQNGFEVHTRMLGDFHPQERYDVLILSNVLEHSLDPKDMLLSARRVLKAGGEIWISCPNSQSWLRRVFGQHWINWHVPFHIIHFSPRILEDLLLDAGFADINIQQITPAAWVGASCISKIFSKEGKPTKQLRNPFLVFSLLLFLRFLFFPLLCVGNWLGKGDCLVTTARASNREPGAGTGSRNGSNGGNIG
jgi:SAM-dependent methyltransferase